jgi:hypothetical protein
VYGAANLYSYIRELWSAVSAIATVVAAGGILFAFFQLRFDAWLKAQELFTDEKFTSARGLILRVILGVVL